MGESEVNSDARNGTSGAVRPAALALLVAGALWGAPAAAQITFDVIGPTEYDLPVDYDPFNVFVQYVTFQDARDLWTSGGSRIDRDGGQTLVGMSKFVRFWSPASKRNIGLAFEVIVPEVGLRGGPDGDSAGGIADPLVGFAGWYKPTASSTLGLQTFVQVPVGNREVGGGDLWKNLTSALWNVRFGPDNRGDFTGDAGFVVHGSSSRGGYTPGMILHTNLRLGYRTSDRLMPFVALDYERQRARDGIVANSETTAGIGLMVTTFDNQSITVKLSHGIDGENRPVTNTVALKYAYSW